MKKTISIAALTAFILSGCAKKAEDITPAYVSPIQYQNYSCNQLQLEMQRISAKVDEIAGIQNKAHTRDTVATTVGLVVFWPALFFLAGGDKEEELRHLKGEYEAIHQASIQKNCNFTQNEDIENEE